MIFLAAGSVNECNLSVCVRAAAVRGGARCQIRCSFQFWQLVGVRTHLIGGRTSCLPAASGQSVRPSPPTATVASGVQNPILRRRPWQHRRPSSREGEREGERAGGREREGWRGKGQSSRRDWRPPPCLLSVIDSFPITSGLHAALNIHLASRPRRSRASVCVTLSEVLPLPLPLPPPLHPSRVQSTPDL